MTEAIIPGAAAAQSIGTDRPDFVESSSTVGKGSVQIEGSVAFDETETLGGEVENFTTPFLFRVGIADGWELRLESDWFIRSTLEEGEAAPEVTTQGSFRLRVRCEVRVLRSRDGQRAGHGRPGSRRSAHWV